jgi:hypothetical protein
VMTHPEATNTVRSRPRVFWLRLISTRGPVHSLGFLIIIYRGTVHVQVVCRVWEEESAGRSQKAVE